MSVNQPPEKDQIIQQLCAKLLVSDENGLTAAGVTTLAHELYEQWIKRCEGAKQNIADTMAANPTQEEWVQMVADFPDMYVSGHVQEMEDDGAIILTHDQLLAAVQDDERQELAQNMQDMGVSQKNVVWFLTHYFYN